MERPLIVGLSGPSSSGKTTIARLLRDLLPGTTILHEDDFYRPESELPYREGFLDWDCAAAIDIPAFASALEYIRNEGKLPQSLVSKEDQNVVGESGVSDESLARRRIELASWLSDDARRRRPIFVVDGFLLLGHNVGQIRKEIDLKLLLRTTFKMTEIRRKARKGYVTLEGFWEDPEGYVEKVVWPGYVDEHAFLFVDGDVEGKVNEDVVHQLGIHVCPGDGSWDIESSLDWIISKLQEAL